ncbi:hypothetical protein F5Y12DRAFT_169990 [Xylaria sp. FL1777]|nr:hypothetical protein F5Y12DRAFT_169990 [Xylaria sp. FL1777]
MITRGGRAMIPFRRVPLTNPSSNRPEPTPPELKYTHKPTPKECAEVKRALATATNFPPELVDIIMDFAEYWACSVASIDYSVTADRGLAIHGGTGGGENRFILRTEPLGLTAWHSEKPKLWQAAAPARRLGKEYPRAELERFIEGPPSTLDHPFRKIVFDIVSRDQGWSDAIDTHGTCRSSWTWFDAGIDRFDKAHTCSGENDERSETEGSNSSEKVPTTCAIRPIWPPLKETSSEYDHQLLPTADHRIQCNYVADHEWQHHRVEWSCTDNIDPTSNAGKELDSVGRGSATGDGTFLRSLKVGDMLTVWGRARFPGWMNSVQKVQVEVYWAL